MTPGLIPYAGYDPHEDDFTGVPLAPLHDDDVVGQPRGPRRNGSNITLIRWGDRSVCIDAARAASLLQAGHSYNEIRHIMAREMGRKTPFTYHAVYMAIRKYNKNHG